MITIVADNNIPFLKGAIEPYASIRYLDGSDIKPSAIAHADALLIRTRTICNESLLQDSQVQFIATATIGFDHIDTDYCNTHSIRWVNAPGCNAASVMQYMASVLANLSIRHEISLEGKTLGIIGVGHVGKKIEFLARILGMNILLNDPPRARVEGNSGFVSLEKLLAGSDIVTLHVPLNRLGGDRTWHLMNETTLGQLKPGSWLINTSRGEVADTSALKAMLSQHKIAGAVLDVWENEPGIDTELLKLVTYATPHIAGYSTDGKSNGTIQVIRGLGRHFNLPLTEWVPARIPEPEDPLITLENKGQSLEKSACLAILYTYDVRNDDIRFRSNPLAFEIRRSDYPVRREFPAYTVMLPEDNGNATNKLKSLGFKIIETHRKEMNG